MSQSPQVTHSSQLQRSDNNDASDVESQIIATPNKQLLDEKLSDAHLNILTGSRLITVLMDIFGRKSTLIGALLCLAISDLICGFSVNGVMLYVFRGFTGIGQGGVQSLTMMIMSDVTTLQNRGKYQGIIGASVGLGNSLGPFICSGFIKMSSWRNFYHMLVPFFVLGSLVVYKIVPGSSPPISRLEKIKNIDYIGFFFSTAGLILILIPINGGGNTYAWDSLLVIAMFVIGGLCLIIFLIVEWRVAKLPMIPLRLFTNKSLNLIFLQSFMFGFTFFSMPYFFSYYFEIVRGWSYLIASCYVMAILLTQATCSIISGLIISKTGHYIYVVKTAYCFTTLGTGLLLMFKTSTNPGVCVIPLLLIGFGNGGIFQPTLVAAQSHARVADRSVVISTRNVIRSLGGAVGLAVCSLIYSNTLLKKIDQDHHLSEFSKTYIRDNLYSKIDIHMLDPSEAEIAKEYYMAAIKNIFYLWFPFMAVSLISAFFLKDHGLRCIDQLDDVKENKENADSTGLSNDEGVADNVNNEVKEIDGK